MKTLMSSNYHRVSKICWNFTRVFCLLLCLKCSRFVLFCLDLQLLPKLKKDLVSTHAQKPRLSITQDLNKIKKNPEHPFVDLGNQERCTKFQQNLLNSMLVGSQSFQLTRQITSFLGNHRVLSKFKYWILHDLISVI